MRQPEQATFAFADDSVGENPGGGSVDGCARAFASHTVPVPTIPRRSDSPQTTSTQPPAPTVRAGRPCLSCSGPTVIVREAALRRWVERCAACPLDRDIPRMSALLERQG